ncbi:general secretion pathway protein K [Candidatus Magnetobacterium bavaricum]|uniref:General secretion pathway protein K n=1 Tax=Candidatus Magnetobacterium bavaricum TaxID=29290 RepID=A0A0F3H083_9BACT|nr:general secretion pathway protein K [Candidatus Magnetobacterium bavaricum]
MEMAVKYLRDYLKTVNYTTFNATTLPVGPIVPSDGTAQEGHDSLVISVRDENARFNINALISPNGKTNETALNCFKRLLKRLEINQEIAYYIADWIDPDREERYTNSEQDAKNEKPFCTDELLQVKKLTADDYKKLLPYITVYGDGLINVNTAAPPVLYCLSEDIDEGIANAIVEFRAISPFSITSDIQKVPGMEHIGKTLLGRITVKSDTFSITSEASGSDMVRDVMVAATMTTGKETVLYWKEF